MCMAAHMSDTFFSANWQEHVSFLQDSGAYIEHVSSYGGWRGSFKNPITEPFFSLLSQPAALLSAGFLLF